MGSGGHSSELLLLAVIGGLASVSVGASELPLVLNTWAFRNATEAGAVCVLWKTDPEQIFLKLS